MKTFKTYLRERKSEALDIIKFLEGKKDVEMINAQGQVVNYSYCRGGLERLVTDHFSGKHIGGGFFSFVMAGKNEREYVLKINRGFKDEAYHIYAALSQKNHVKTNVFPEILWLGTIPRSTSVNNEISVAIIEAVNIIGDNYTEDPKGYTFAQNKCFVLEYLIRFAKTGAVEATPSALRDMYPGRGWKDEDFEDLDKRMMWAKIFVKRFAYPDVIIDLKPANIGFRKDGSLVVLDPVA
jgi:hypothetical protein